MQLGSSISLQVLPAAALPEEIQALSAASTGTRQKVTWASISHTLGSLYMSATEHMDIASAARLYKDLLRKERAAWDALFALPPTPGQLRVWRRSTIEADHARAAFLEPSSLRPNEPAADAPADRPPVKQALKQAIQQQKAAWTAYERSLAAGLADADDLRVVWLDAIARVRAVRKLVHEQGFTVTASAQRVESTRANIATVRI